MISVATRADGLSLLATVLHFVLGLSLHASGINCAAGLRKSSMWPVILRQSAESRDESQLAWLGMTDRQSSNPSIIHLFPKLKQTVIKLMQQKNQHCVSLSLPGVNIQGRANAVNWASTFSAF